MSYSAHIEFDAGAMRCMGIGTALLTAEDFTNARSNCRMMPVT